MKMISVKSTLYLILMAFTLMACHSPDYISGKIQGIEEEGNKIYLIQPETLMAVGASYFGKVIDSADVHADGSFEFHNKPLTTELVLLELALQPSVKAANYLQSDDPTRSNFMPILWQPGESIKITAKWSAFQKSFSMEHPSERNLALSNLRDINLQAYETYLAGKHWDVEEGSQLLEKQHAILQYQTQLMNFADTTSFLLPAMVALRWASPENDYERVPEFLVRQCARWKEAQPDHPWVKQLCEKCDPSDLPVLVGDVFPNLQFPMLTKDTLALNDLLGKKLTIIDLWASWCAPCRKENREVFVPLWDQYHDRGLEIIAYGLESDKATWRAAAERDGADRWLQASHLQGDDAPLLQKIRIQTIPANYILNDKGVVVAKNIHGNALKDLVKSYME